MNDSTFSDLGFVVVVIGIALVAVVYYFAIIKPFNERRRYINLEMHRAKSDAGKRYWKHEMKKLYKTLIPFGKR